MFKFIQDSEGNPSTTRVMCLLAGIPIFFILIGLAYRVYKGDGGYAEMSILITACGAYFTAIQYGKNNALKIETTALKPDPVPPA